MLHVPTVLQITVVAWDAIIYFVKIVTVWGQQTHHLATRRVASTVILQAVVVLDVTKYCVKIAVLLLLAVVVAVAVTIQAVLIV